MQVNSPEYWDFKWKEYQIMYAEQGKRRIDLPGFDMILSKIKEGDRVLDFGCGLGEFLTHVAHAMPTVKLYGCDISQEACLTVLNKDFDVAWYEDITIFTDYFDVITVIHSLEHFIDPVQCIKDLKKALKPNGWLIVILPYHDWYWIEHYRVWGKTEIEECFAHFDCNINTVIRNPTVLLDNGKIMPKIYPNGDLFEEAICFIQFNS